MMKIALPLLCLLVGAGANTLSPVTRVVELLQHLSTQIEVDGKAEEDLYETYVCWAKSIVSQKTQSNAASESRIDELETYIADLDAGRIELTTERVDLEKQIKTLTDEIEVATATREKEHLDWEDAKNEMNQGIDALDSAIQVLKTATEGHEEGVLLSVKGQMGATFTQRAKEAVSLQKAAQLGAKVLSKGDALFLHRLLTGEVPKADWKKLNRKATFKKSYKARSFKIQGVLAKLLEDFAGNLEDATKTENEAQTTFDTLMGSKNTELGTAQEALLAMKSESGAKGMSREESVEELTRLQNEVSQDTKFIGQVTASLAEKKEEWKDRQALRAGELAAISKAVAILHSDDSRDLFKKSFASQDESAAAFVQVRSTAGASRARRQRSAVEALRQAGKLSGDARLSALATSALAAGSHFEKVIDAIDKMLVTLQSEEDTDLESKESCEADRAEQTKDAQKMSATIDEQMDLITRTKAEIEAIVKAHADAKAKFDANAIAIGEIVKQMQKTTAEATAEMKDDQDAIVVVKSATQVLSKFYQENELSLTQKATKAKQPFASTAGEAPPPPPPTWENPNYGGKPDESLGVVAVLEMISEDIQKDHDKTKSEMDASLAASTKEKTDLTNENNELTAEMTDLDGTKAIKETLVTDTDGLKATQKIALVGKMKQLEDASSFCEFFTINYPLRLKNRQVEMDGLRKAKTILNGGSFTKVDENREIKPGDALLQAPRRLRSVRKL